MNPSRRRSQRGPLAWWTLGLVTGFFLFCPAAVIAQPSGRRAPADSTRRWLENMIWHHRFSDAEIIAATGMAGEEINAAKARWNITPLSRPARRADAPLLVLPYPGGRHPRIGFLDGAVDPQRETKISVFLPWDEQTDYVVVDVPEAIWSNLGLTYLAHTHVPTLWTKQKIQLPPLEWTQEPDGTLKTERQLPNGIAFGTTVKPGPDLVRMEMWLKNGTQERLTDLRVQNCVMLKGASDFNQQTNANKLILSPYVAVRSSDGRRWVITAWVPSHRPWVNPPVPCLHSDPKFPECAPGATERIFGFLSFYEGVDIIGEFRRLDGSGWQTGHGRAQP